MFKLLQEAWAGDVLGALWQRGAVRGRPRLQLCALLFAACRFMCGVELLGELGKAGC